MNQSALKCWAVYEIIANIPLQLWGGAKGGWELGRHHYNLVEIDFYKIETLMKQRRNKLL
jgi:hypothetical protein